MTEEHTLISVPELPPSPDTSLSGDSTSLECLTDISLGDTNPRQPSRPKHEVKRPKYLDSYVT